MLSSISLYREERFEKYGIKVARDVYRTALTGRAGTLRLKPEGDSTHFDNRFTDIEDTLDAIRTEYQVEIVDVNTPRIPGLSNPG